MLNKHNDNTIFYITKDPKKQFYGRWIIRISNNIFFPNDVYWYNIYIVWSVENKSTAFIAWSWFVVTDGDLMKGKKKHEHFVLELHWLYGDLERTKIS